ncbi:hypothetical protein [Brucella inopinata]|uniref:hypothetical protein n=1 Tax=Brucella inopinata TaxID=1218315 RepID=UPI00087100FD|nr:hypothetical protein [Brucella inopinata]SCD23524.1 hypothetical protein BR141012304_11103 [Brucella inopinata]
MAEKTELSGVRAKLKAHKDANSGERTITLSESGISCTVPNFINHGLWMRAQRVAKGDTPKAQAAFVCEVVRFEGEKLTLTDLAELVSSGDTLQLIGEIFGGKDDNSEGELGNVLN